MTLLRIWIGHSRRLAKAVGISTLTFRCHGDTWTVIQQIMRTASGWSPSPAVPCPSGVLVEVQLSGPKVVAMLHEMRWHTMSANGFNRAFARRIYLGLAEVVELVEPTALARALPPVVLDDNARGADDDTIEAAPQP